MAEGATFFDRARYSAASLVGLPTSGGLCLARRSGGPGTGCAGIEASRLAGGRVVPGMTLGWGSAVRDVGGALLCSNQRSRVDLHISAVLLWLMSALAPLYSACATFDLVFATQRWARESERPTLHVQCSQ